MIGSYKEHQRAARTYQKTAKKMQRISRLCKNNRFVFDRYVSKEEREDITKWCDENLNGAHFWFFEANYPSDRGADIGFHHKWDLDGPGKCSL